MDWCHHKTFHSSSITSEALSHSIFLPLRSLHCSIWIFPLYKALWLFWQQVESLHLIFFIKRGMNMVDDLIGECCALSRTPSQKCDFFYLIMKIFGTIFFMLNVLSIDWWTLSLSIPVNLTTAWMKVFADQLTNYF